MLELLSGALDFALWKAQKTSDEIAWDSPWGKVGQAGASSVRLCPSISAQLADIHGGGQDLKFPHHENEIAQSKRTAACLLRTTGCGRYIMVIREISNQLNSFFTVRCCRGVRR